MKAQLSLEFYFSLVIFVLFVTFIFFRLITFFPQYSSELTNQRLRSEAYQISELLINDVGYPGNWDNDILNAKRLGFSDETKNKTNLISRSKVTAFGSLCGDYNRVLELLDIQDGFLVTLIEKSSDTPNTIMTCSPAAIYTRVKVNITRLVTFDDGSYGELTVNVWKP